MRQRDRREAQAIAYLRRLNRCASVLEIGEAALRGEKWAASPKTWKAKAAIGLDIAVALTRRGLLRPTAENEFEIAA